VIIFNEELHTYTDDNTGVLFTSVTTLLGKYKPFFDSETAAKRVAAREGVSYEIVLEIWEKEKQIACDRGTPIHKAMEEFILHKKVNTSYPQTMYDSFTDILREYRVKSISSEKLLHLDEFQVAGTADIIIDHDDKHFSVLDFKTNKRIRSTSQYDEFLLDPVQHLPNCEYTVYSLQLSMYAYMYEQMSGKKCKGIGILYLKDDNWINMPSVYLKNETISILQNFKLKQK